MKTFPRFALAAALLAGASGLALTPALAKDKKKEEQTGPQKPSVSNADALKQIQAAQTAIGAKDYATATTALTAADAAAKTDGDRYFITALRLQMTAGQLAPNDPTADAKLAPLLDQLLANPVTPQEDLGRYTYSRGNMYYNAKQFPQALAAFQKAQQLGYQNENLALQIVRAKTEGGDVAGGLADLEKSILAEKAAGRPVSEDQYRFAISRYYKLGDNAGTQRVTAMWLHDFGTPKNWRDAIYTFGFQGAGAKRIDSRQRVDLFRLMRATNSLVGADYLEYAQLTYDTGLARESVSVMDEGVKNGKIPAAGGKPTGSAAQLLGLARQQLGTEGTAEAQEAKAKRTGTGRALADVGDFYLGNNNWAKAAELYRAALAAPKPGTPAMNADEVNTHLGIALANAGDKTGAKQAFSSIKTAPRTEIAQLWTVWLDAPANGAAAPVAAN
ncbi:tetratricopeptide repeat protein [Sphingomonas aracearum]|uniref:Tetratricopeptide repeat protein n=1 Tax=Sphingomonas aracearum TaxID=2283317 RepID=A0A369VWM8_9SPHN|nr:tetratricopeptide repeat protein [Sphingomonas aracearum]RDE06533.1 hypothetical protein DVW87_02155 [Sphingomonas aracearum]